MGGQDGASRVIAPSPAPVLAGMTGVQATTVQAQPVQAQPVSGVQGQPIRPVVQGMYPSSPQRTLALENRVKELEALVAQKDQRIADLEAALAKTGSKHIVSSRATRSKVVSGFQQLTGSQPGERYVAVEPNDQIDVRLEEFYNGTGSKISFHRINHGFYRFGGTTVELDIINHKLMAKTEDEYNWNRNKFGPIEKFLATYENIERERV